MLFLSVDSHRGVEGTLLFGDHVLVNARSAGPTELEIVVVLGLRYRRGRGIDYNLCDGRFCEVNVRHAKLRPVVFSTL